MKCGHEHLVGDEVHLLFRPVQIDDGTVFQGYVADVVFQQDRFKVTLENGLFAYFQNAPQIGQQITVKVGVKCLG
jgi:hypothetical protein